MKIRLTLTAIVDTLNNEYGQKYYTEYNENYVMIYRFQVVNVTTKIKYSLKQLRWEALFSTVNLHNIYDNFINNHHHLNLIPNEIPGNDL